MKPLREGSLFTGTNALGMAAGDVLDCEPAWFSDVDPGASKLLAHHYPRLPNHGDITGIDWDQVEPVDVLTGGFPCTDLSLAGRQLGLRLGTRSGLWTQMAYAISKLQPSLVLIENVRGLASAPAHSDMEPCPWCVGDGPDEPVLRALGAVLGDLAGLGYDAVWCGLPASAVGAPHGRFRFFIAATRDTTLRGRHVASTAGQRGESAGPTGRPGLAVADSDCARELQPGGSITERGRRTSDGDSLTADSAGDGRNEGRPEPARLVGGPDAAERGASPADTDSALGTQQGSVAPGPSEGAESEAVGGIGRGGAALDWSQYEPAIRRWEAILGRPAPAPTVVGARGGRVLNPALPEWMMGLPEGWITSVPGLSRNDQLKLAGNGVVPHQAVAAFRHLLPLLTHQSAA